jgi:hypothetical protein
MRRAFWFDVYKVNDGKVKSYTPNFNEVKERTPVERLDQPFNTALQNHTGGIQQINEVEKDDDSVKFIMSEEDLIPDNRLKLAT